MDIPDLIHHLPELSHGHHPFQDHSFLHKPLFLLRNQPTLIPSFSAMASVLDPIDGKICDGFEGSSMIPSELDIVFDRQEDSPSQPNALLSAIIEEEKDSLTEFFPLHRREKAGEEDEEEELQLNSQQSLLGVPEMLSVCNNILGFNSHHLSTQVGQGGIMMPRSRSSNGLGQVSNPPLMTAKEVPFYPSPLQSRSFPFHLQGIHIKPLDRNMRKVFSAGDIQEPMHHGENFPILGDQSNLGKGRVKIGHYTMEERKARVNKYRQKRTKRNYNKKIKYACRKTLAESRLRIQGRFARTDDPIDGVANRN